MTPAVRARIVLAFRSLAVGVVLLLLFRGSRLVWQFLPARTADVVIVDKTVAHENYRGHSGLTWLLTAMKVLRPDGREYDTHLDYLGFDPLARVGHDLTADSLAGADAVFLADTYGVYKADFLAPDDPNTIELSRRIYGGLSLEEATAIATFAQHGGLVLGEFNTFASPTEDAPRAKMEALFGARWTHWVGRFWRDLSDDSDVPVWLRKEHQRIFGHPLARRGSALIFMREEDMVVLRVGEELTDDALRIERVDADEDPERAKLPRAAQYRLWFDVVEAGDADVIYQYVVPTRDNGANTLFHHGLNARFPAVLRRRGISAWYFAGNFIDATAERGDPRRAGLLWWRKEMLGDVDAPEGLFWGWYAPLLERLIGPRTHAKPR